MVKITINKWDRDHITREQLWIMRGMENSNTNSTSFIFCRIGTGKRYRKTLQVKFPGPGKYETNKDENTGMSMVKIMNKTCGFAKRWNRR